MPAYFPPWDTTAEPNESNIRQWMDNIHGKHEPIEQARWNQGNIDTLFYAGEQRFINSYFNFNGNNSQEYYFNLIAQPINMVTGYQRQHRKSINYLPLQNTKQEFSDDLTKLITYANNNRGIMEKFSTGCEQSAISGMVLAQPYLDFTDDPISGTMDLRIWSYNSFMTDAYWKEPDMSDANFIWCQQYLSKNEAINYFPERINQISNMSGFSNRTGKFYFLPENYNLARNDLLVMSHIWYRSKRMKKMLYNKKDGDMYEYLEDEKYLDEMVKKTQMFEIVEVQVPTWKLAVVLNDQVMFIGRNPLGFDECPMVPIYWNYDPHIAQFDLRVRSLTRSMRSSQFLLNRRIILNHDISESSINTGWMRRENSIVNEEDLRYAGQGKDIIIKDNGEPFEQCIQKIIPNAVPASDMQLADQLADFIFKTSGVNQELLGMANDSVAGIEVMLRQGAGLVTLQKYFDQWDVSLKLLGRLEQKIIQNKWTPSKIARILGKEPNVEFLNKTFSRYDVAVAEGLDTTIQKQQEFIQIRQLNEIVQGVIPAKFIIQASTIQGKNEMIAAIEEQEKHAAEMQQHSMMLEQAKMEAELQEIQSRAVSNVATARERSSRSDSNVGLFEERISMIMRNRQSAIKDKVESLKTLLEVYQTHDQYEIAKAEKAASGDEFKVEFKEHQEEGDAQARSAGNNFLSEMMQQNKPQSNINPNTQEGLGS